MIRFEASTHTYSDADTGEPIASVSQICKWAGWAPAGDHYKAGAAQRGTSVHEATAQLDRGEREPSDFRGSRVGGYLASWYRFVKESGAEILAVEQIVGSLELGCAGTLDRLVRIDGLTYIVDLKSGRYAAWHSLQLAGYAYCLQAKYARLAVYLAEDGTYRRKEFKEAGDLKVFAGAVKLCGRWPEENARDLAEARVESEIVLQLEKRKARRAKWAQANDEAWVWDPGDGRSAS